MADPWLILGQLLLLIGVAAAFGAVAERLKQNAIIGYLAAGMLLGPNVLHLVQDPEVVHGIAELGVALLLFSIGLELSVHRIRNLGRFPLLGGGAQVIATWIVVAALWALTHSWRESIAMGAVAAMSSTACVLRVLVDRAELDSTVGRNALGILLVQDMAAIPMVLILTLLGRGGPLRASLGEFAVTMGEGVLLVAAFWIVFVYVAPRILQARGFSRNRELVILLATICVGGSAWAAHALHLSPALGAFVAGVLLGETPFAPQIEADVAPLRAIFVTLFFGATGMLADPLWIAAHWQLVLSAVGVVLVLKTGLVYLLARAFGQMRQDALGTGMSLAQVGEFGLVLATVAAGAGLFDAETFALAASVIGATLFLTPYLIAIADPAGRSLTRERGTAPGLSAPAADDQRPRVVVIGFGPSGRRVVDAMYQADRNIDVTVLDMNPAGTADAHAAHARFIVGDGRQTSILVHAGVPQAGVVVVTLPDPQTAAQVIANARALAPDITLIARARYHALRWRLERAGADITVDEEYEIGSRLASATKRAMHARTSTWPRE